MSGRYVVIVNVPGYGPEDEPTECETWVDALTTLATQLELTWDTDPRDATEAELDALLREIARLRFEHPRYLDMQFGPYAHCIDRI